MKYKLSEHGDSLEKSAASFVNKFLINYEEIWKIYIGNKGDQTKATILNYPITCENLRQEFWEHCYTVLESCILAYNIKKSDAFIKPIIDFDTYENFNKNLIAFFTYIGRIIEHIGIAGIKIGLNINDPRLNKFYLARNIVIHGKVIPISIDDMGLIKFPTFITTPSTSYGWPNKGKIWAEGHEIHHDYVEETLDKMISEILQSINDIFGQFLSLIHDELKKTNSTIKFEYNSSNSQINFPGTGGYSGSSGLSGNDDLCKIQFSVSQSKE